MIPEKYSDVDAKKFACTSGHGRERRRLVEHIVDDEPHREVLGRVQGHRGIDQPPVFHAEVVLGRRCVLVVEIDGARERGPANPKKTARSGSPSRGFPWSSGYRGPSWPQSSIRRKARSGSLNRPATSAPSCRGSSCANCMLPSCRGNVEGVVQRRGEALEFQQARIDVADMETGDLPRRAARERLTGWIARIVGRVVAGVQNLTQRQGLDRLRQLDVDIVQLIC